MEPLSVCVATNEYSQPVAPAIASNVVPSTLSMLPHSHRREVPAGSADAVSAGRSCLCRSHVAAIVEEASVLLQ